MACSPARCSRVEIHQNLWHHLTISSVCIRDVLILFLLGPCLRSPGALNDFTRLAALRLFSVMDHCF